MKGMPVSVEVDESLVCGCGREKDLGAFTESCLERFITIRHQNRPGPLFSTSFMKGLGVSKFRNFHQHPDIAETFLVKINYAREWQAWKPKALDLLRVQDDGIQWKMHKPLCIAQGK